MTSTGPLQHGHFPITRTPVAGVALGAWVPTGAAGEPVALGSFTDWVPAAGVAIREDARTAGGSEEPDTGDVDVGRGPDMVDPDAGRGVVPDRLVPDRLVPDMLVPDRLVPDRLVPDMLGPDAPDAGRSVGPVKLEPEVERGVGPVMLGAGEGMVASSSRGGGTAIRLDESSVGGEAALIFTRAALDSPSLSVRATVAKRKRLSSAQRGRHELLGA